MNRILGIIIQSTESIKPSKLVAATKEYSSQIIKKIIDKAVKVAKNASPDTLHAGSSISNYFPVIGGLKQVQEAYTGKTLSGHDLTVFGRINHLVINGSYFLAFPVVFLNALLAVKLYSLSWLLDAVQYYPEINNSVHKVVKNNSDRRFLNMKILKFKPVQWLLSLMDILEKIHKFSCIRMLFFKNQKGGV